MDFVPPCPSRKQEADDVRIGSLVGVRADGVPHWGVAIVRRMVRSDAGMLQVGAEMLANQIASVAIQQDGCFSDAQPALWLYTKQGDTSGENQLLIKADAYSVYYSLNTQIDGKNYLLIPHELEEKGMDYDLARFRVIVHDEDPE